MASLVQMHPQLVDLYSDSNDLSPDQLVDMIHQCIWSHSCIFGCGAVHEWRATPNALAKSGLLVCPLCTSHAPRRCACVSTSFWTCTVLEKSLAHRFPVIAAEFSASNGFSPSLLFPNCMVPFDWEHQCILGCGRTHTWRAPPNNRCGKGSGCPLCAPNSSEVCECRTSNSRICKAEDSIAVRFPEIAADFAADLNGRLTAFQVCPFTPVEMWWRHTCRFGCGRTHEWLSSVSTRTRAKGECPKCADLSDQHCECRPNSFKECQEYERSLEYRFPDIARIFASDLNMGVTAAQVYGRSEQTFHWRHECVRGCGSIHEWTAPVIEMTNGGACPKCSPKNPDDRCECNLQGFRECVNYSESLQCKFPDIAAQLDPAKNNGVTATRVYAASKASFIWSHPCAKGCGRIHDWPATVTHRTGMQSGCHFCCRGVVGKACPCSSLTALFPQVASEIIRCEEDLDWISHGSKRPFWFRCRRGHEYKCTLNSKTAGGTVCPVCNESKLEIEMREALIAVGANFTPQVRIDNSRFKFDFGGTFNGMRFLVECDGGQHFFRVPYFQPKVEDLQRQFERDLHKEKLAMRYGYHLLRLPFTKAGSGEQLLRHFLSAIDASGTLIMRADGELYKQRGYTLK